MSEPGLVMRDRSILVTGGAGAIGANLVRHLADGGASCVTVLDDLSSAAEWSLPQRDNVLFVRGSVLDDASLSAAFAQRPALVFHLAALFANQNSVDHPEDDLRTNGLGTLRVLERSRDSDVERVVYASSGCSVYGKSPVPLREDYLSLDLDTPYQITKMLGELYCNFFKNFYGLRTVRARFFNSYGPGEIPGRYRNVIPNFFYWAMRREALPITGTGEETRDWTFVEDIVDGLLRAAASDAAIGDAFNIASGRETRVIDMATRVNELTGNAAGIRYLERRRWDTKTRLLASIDKAHDVLGYSPATSFDDGLVRTHGWFRENWTAIEKSARF